MSLYENLYAKRSINANGNLLGMIHQGTRGCADLAAIYNLVTINYSSVYGQEGPVPEKTIKSIINDTLEESIANFEDISDAQAKEVKHVLSNIRTKFSLQPRLSGHMDFVTNASYLLCRILGLTVFHVWVLDPEVSSYDSLCTFSHQELLKYATDLGQNDKICNDLLADYKDQMTPFGFGSLSAEMNDDAVALLFCRNTLHLVHKHSGVIYTYVSDEGIRGKMPQAIWMLFEEEQQRNIYFTEDYVPVKGQPCEKEAKEWYLKFIQTQRKKDEKGESPKKDEEDKGHQKDGKNESQKDEEDYIQKDTKAERNKRRRAARKLKKLQSSQQVQSHDVALESSEHEEDTDGENNSSAQDDTAKVQSVGSAPETDNVLEVPKDVASPETDNVLEVPKRVASPETDNVLEVSKGVASPETDNVFEAPEGVASPETDNVLEAPKGVASPETDNVLEAPKDVPSPETDNVPEVPEGVASDFLRFLIDFKDDGCQEHYFEGIVAAFASHRPLFYVPYDFIMAHNEELALNIQDNYTRIYEDLNKSVVAYLSKNKVYFNDAVIKINGLPEPKSVQTFLDFIDSIDIHEHYAVYGADPEALPSYDSRRMALGYLGCIITKFRSGRCWAGKWSEPNMKVKNKGSEFVIDLKDDYELNADLGFLDLTKFCETVLERLKFNGRSPPFFDELQDDMMLINDCIGNPEKWERFLELIGNPLALKPPLVRASFLCDVYIVGYGNSTGDPPRYHPLFKGQGCYDWRPKALANQLLAKIYGHQYNLKRRKLKHIIDNWAAKHWHVFKFSRHFIHHVLELTKGKDWIQKVKDISEIEILLSRTIWKAIAKSVRFLVLNCGVDGVFSSAWRHYVGSDYRDKPNGNLDDAASDIVQGLVDSISDQEISGYVSTEVSAYSEPEHISIITSDADLTEFQTVLNDNGFKFEINDDGTLYCGSILVWKRIYEEESEVHTAIVVEGPYSVEYESVYCSLTGWLGL